MENLNISEIDLTRLTAAQLAELRDRTNALLAQSVQTVSDRDLLLDYSIKLYTKEGLASDVEGSFKLNGILHPRMLADAPGRFEQSFMQQIFKPINADLYDVLEGTNTTDNNLRALPNNSTSYKAAPGINIYGGTQQGIIPGE